LEERVLVLALKFPEVAKLIGDDILAEFSEAGRGGFAAVVAGDSKALSGDYFEALFIKSESETIDAKSAAAEAEFCVGQIKENILKNKLAALALELVRAEKAGDKETADELRAEYNLLAKSV
jgi:hypothetical protein